MGSGDAVWTTKLKKKREKKQILQVDERAPFRPSGRGCKAQGVDELIEERRPGPKKKTKGKSRGASWPRGFQKGERGGSRKEA